MAATTSGVDHCRGHGRGHEGQPRWYPSGDHHQAPNAYLVSVWRQSKRFSQKRLLCLKTLTMPNSTQNKTFANVAQQ